MEQNNKISADLMQVKGAKKSKGKRSQPQVSRPPRPQPAGRTMTIAEWRELTSTGSNSQEERKRGVRQCPICKRTKLTNTHPGIECMICQTQACNPCAGKTKLIPLENHNVSQMPKEALGHNDYEQKILTDYLTAKRITLKTVFKEELKAMERTKWTYKNPTGRDITLNKDSHVCNDCFSTVWSDFIYRYRTSVQSSMPTSVKRRGNCWYGKECTTQAHNSTHAQKYNHICDKRSDK